MNDNNFFDIKVICCSRQKKQAFVFCSTISICLTFSKGAVYYNNNHGALFPGFCYASLCKCFLGC